MLRLVVLLVSMVAFASVTNALKTRPCSNGRPQPSLVMIADCCEMPCIWVRGTDERMMIVFESPFNSKTLRYERIATALGATLGNPAPTKTVKTCDWLSGSSCPITQGQKITATFISTMLSNFPLVSFSNEISVIDEEDRTVTCFEYDSQIVLAQN